MGFSKYQEGPSKIGWLVNMMPTLQVDESKSSGRAAVDFYFIEEDGGTFKSTVCYEPYFYIACRVRPPFVVNRVEIWKMLTFLLMRVYRKVTKPMSKSGCCESMKILSRSLNGVRRRI